MAKKVVSRFKSDRPSHYIREWRKHRGLTQERLAERVDMSTSSISQLETGKQDYSQRTLEAIAQALNCLAGELLMRNPSVDDAPWSLLDSLRPETRRQAIELLKTLARTDRSERAA